MALRPLPLPAGIAGAVWLDAMPGRHEPWAAFVAEAQAMGLGLIVALTPQDEITALSPDYAQALQQGRLPCRWMHLPMRDFGLATDSQAFRAGIVQLADAVRGGESVLLHCAAGIGRTGCSAACLLRQLGWSAEQAVAAVRRAGSNPQSALQAGLIERFG